jgi:peptide-methionine (S)-S-oxide reductase
MFLRSKSTLPAPDEALPGRPERPFRLAEKHLVLDAPLVTDEVPDGYEVATFGLGCFWGAEEVFWQVPGVWSTSVGYAGGSTPHPSYEEVCSGRTGHTEAVRVVYDPAQVSFADLVATFYEVHDPTQGMRQGNDMGTQYRSAIYWSTPEQEQVAREVTARYQPELTRRGYGEITTEIKPAAETPYYYAEDHHQQYLVKNPFGYRCHSATGIKVPQA